MKLPAYIKLFFWLLLFVALTTFTACGSDSSSTGTVQVALTDNVDPNLKEVVISIKEVRVVPNGQEATGEEGLPLIKSFDHPNLRTAGYIPHHDLLVEAPRGKKPAI